MIVPVSHARITAPVKQWVTVNVDAVIAPALMSSSMMIVHVMSMQSVLQSAVTLDNVDVAPVSVTPGGKFIQSPKIAAVGRCAQRMTE